PESLLVLAKGIAANVFGGWVSLLVVWAIAANLPSLVLAALFAWACLSHPAAAIILLTLVPIWLLVGLSRNQIDARRAGAMTAAAAAGAGFAWLLYYRTTMSTMQESLGLVGSALQARPLSFFSFRWVQAGKTVQDLLYKFGALPLVMAFLGLRRHE